MPPEKMLYEASIDRDPPRVPSASCTVVPTPLDVCVINPPQTTTMSPDAIITPKVTVLAVSDQVAARLCFGRVRSLANRM